MGQKIPATTSNHQTFSSLPPFYCAHTKLFSFISPSLLFPLVPSSSIISSWCFVQSINVRNTLAGPGHFLPSGGDNNITDDLHPPPWHLGTLTCWEKIFQDKKIFQYSQVKLKFKKLSWKEENTAGKHPAAACTLNQKPPDVFCSLRTSTLTRWN